MKIFNLEPEAFGIDFSDLRLRIVKLKKKGLFFDLDSWNEVNIPSGIIVDGEVKNQEKLSLIIKKAVNEVNGKKIKIKRVIASLPEKEAFLQVIKVPKMDLEELETAIPFEAENYVPLAVDQLYLDYEVISSRDGQNLDVLIGAMPKIVVDPYVSCIKRAGFIPVALEVECQSITRALIKNQVSPFPVLIIDFGKSTTSFIVFSGHSLRFTSSIDISSQRLNKAIADNLKVDLKKAEELKLKYGLEVSKKDKISREVIGAMVPLLADFIKQVKKHINYYHTHANNLSISSGGAEIKKVLLCGKGSNLKGLPNFIFSELKIPTDLANPWVNIISNSSKKIPEIPFKDSLGYTTALGLALRGIKK